MDDNSDLVEFQGSLAAWLIGPKTIVWRPILLPRTLPRGSVLLEVLMTGVCGTDRHLYNYTPGGHGEALRYPMGLGHEFVGRVLRTAETVGNTVGDPLKEGDRVVVYPSAWGCGQCYSCRVLLSPNICLRPHQSRPAVASGGFATHYLAGPGSLFYAVPPDLPNELAVLVEPLAGASRAVERALVSSAPDRGDTSQFGGWAIVQGSGAIGAFVTALLVGRGMHVSAVGAPEARLGVLRAIGAEAAVLLEGSLQLTPLQIQGLRQATPHGLGADLVMEVSGSPTAFEDALQLARPGGTIVEFGAYTSRGHAQVSPSLICRKDLTVLGSNGYGPRQFSVALDILASAAGSALKAVTTRTVALKDVPDVLSTATEDDVMKVLVNR